MSSPTLTERPSDRLAADLAAEAHALRDRFAEQEWRHQDQEQSPQAFYERSVERSDVREILERLANG